MKNIRELLVRKKDSHKGDYGHVLIIAGSRGMSGAAILCGLGALRMGAGLVTIASPTSIQPIIASAVIEALTLPLAETKLGYVDKKALNQIIDYYKYKKINSTVLGPGLGMNKETHKVIQDIIHQIPCTGVLDADGLNQLGGNIRVLAQSPGKWIMTPHPGELARLLGKTKKEIQKNRMKYAFLTAHQSRSVCVLKGFQTIITDGKRTKVNRTGNPGMATGGSGDILSGMIGALIAQNLDTFDAAQWGVYFHGLAGDIAAKEKTQMGLIARDIVEYIPKALKKATERLSDSATK